MKNNRREENDTEKGDLTMITIENLIEEIKLPREKEILLDRLSGYSLEEVGQKFNVTKERIRMIQLSIIPDSRLEEEKYLDLFERYALTPQLFTVITGLSEKSYRYLYIISKKNINKKNIFELWFDEEISQDIKNKVFFALKENKGFSIEVNNASRDSIVKIILQEEFCNQRSIDDFISSYNDFLKRYHCTEKKPMVSKAFINKLELLPYILLSKGRIIRFYNTLDRDFTELLQILCLHKKDNLEYSTLKFYRTHHAIMKKYDIRDEYELHNLLRKLSKIEKYDMYLKNIEFGRMPIIKIGSDVNRNRQLLELMQKNQISITTASVLYEQAYGVRSIFTDKKIRKHLKDQQEK